jgi:hypothetical protein
VRILKLVSIVLKAANKGNQSFGLMKRTSASREKKAIIKLFKAFGSHLEYCIQAGRPHFVKGSV